jgi:phosphoribosylformylglycinamidine synthase
MHPTVNIVYFPGTNCQRETAVAFAKVGARPRQVFLTDILAGRARLDDADLLCLPGGFSFGDHIASGVIAAKFLTTRLAEQLANCRRRPLIAICNGFQIAVRAGIFGAGLALAHNAVGTFQHVARQPHLVVPETNCVWLSGLGGQTLHFPCAHGEGRLVFNQRESWRPALVYPHDQNPDGTTEAITGIATPDGLALGLMNHPERLRSDENLEIFAAGVRAVS